MAVETMRVSGSVAITHATGTRLVITDLATLNTEAPTWLGQDFAIDLETTGLDPTKDRILGVALTFADGRSYYLVFEHTVPLEEHFSGGVESDVDLYPRKHFLPRQIVCLSTLQALLGQPGVTAVAHNLKFELHFLKKAGIEFGCALADTMLAAQLLDENRRVGLKNFGSLVGLPLKNYTELPHYPGFAKQDILGVPLDLVADYAMDDTVATWALWTLFQPGLKTEGVEHAFYDIWMPLTLALQEMEERGIAMNIAGVREAKAKYEQIVKEAEEQVWQEGIKMVLSRYDHEGGWEGIPSYYICPLDTVEHTPYEDIPHRALVRGRVLPVWRKYNKDGKESRAWRPKTLGFNPGSQNQIKDLLFSYLKLPVDDIAEDFDLRFTGDESAPIWSADRDNLRVIKHEMGEECPEVIDHLLTYRKASKLLSTYLNTYEEKCDAGDHYALRTNFNQASTDTGRLSSSKPNLQNQPARGEEGKLIRSLFVARPGYKLVVADYSMMELRLAAHFSKDPVMISAFRQGLDLHAVTAAGQMGVSYEEFLDALAADDPKARTARFIGKTSNFGLLYGMGARKFQKLLLVDAGVKVSLEGAFDLIDDFNRTYAALTRWKNRIQQEITKRGYIDTIAGRKRRLPDVIHPVDWIRRAALRQGVNARIQGSCADIICAAIPPIQDMFRYLGGSLLLQVHDELVGEVPEAHAEHAAQIMSKLMTESTQHFLVPLVAEAGIGDTWGDAK